MLYKFIVLTNSNKTNNFIWYTDKYRTNKISYCFDTIHGNNFYSKGNYYIEANNFKGIKII